MARYHCRSCRTRPWPRRHNAPTTLTTPLKTSRPSLPPPPARRGRVGWGGGGGWGVREPGWHKHPSLAHTTHTSQPCTHNTHAEAVHQPQKKWSASDMASGRVNAPGAAGAAVCCGGYGEESGWVPATSETHTRAHTHTHTLSHTHTHTCGLNMSMLVCSNASCFQAPQKRPPMVTPCMPRLTHTHFSGCARADPFTYSFTLIGDHARTQAPQDGPRGRW